MQNNRDFINDSKTCMNSNIKKTVISIILTFIIVTLFTVGYLILFKSGFYHDSLIIFGQDTNKKDYAIILELGRYQSMPFMFDHIYSIKIVNDDNLYNETEFSQIMGHEIMPIGFFKKFVNNNDHKRLIENYSFSLEANKKIFQLDLTNLNSDFIINNSLADLTYLNVGTDNLKIDGNNNEINYILTKNLSIDSSKALAGNNVKYKSNCIWLWDDANNFYLIDVSQVNTKNDVYNSHKWAICKNNQTNLMKKIVGNIELNAENDKPNINVLIPGFNNATFNLQKTKEPQKGSKYCLIKGQIKDESDERNVRGVYYFADYTK